MSMAKHYVAYDSDSYNIFVDQQTLHEVYVAPFDAAVKAGVASIMCSYNKINGAFACGNPDTLKTILFGELGFKGFVTSDWGGVHNVHFINNGLTMEMPGEVADDSPFAGMMHTYFRTRPENSGRADQAKPRRARRNAWRHHPGRDQRRRHGYVGLPDGFRLKDDARRSQRWLDHRSDDHRSRAARAL